MYLPEASLYTTLPSGRKTGRRCVFAVVFVHFSLATVIIAWIRALTLSIRYKRLTYLTFANRPIVRGVEGVPRHSTSNLPGKVPYILRYPHKVLVPVLLRTSTKYRPLLCRVYFVT